MDYGAFGCKLIRHGAPPRALRFAGAANSSATCLYHIKKTSIVRTKCHGCDDGENNYLVKAETEPEDGISMELLNNVNPKIFNQLYICVDRRKDGYFFEGTITGKADPNYDYFKCNVKLVHSEPKVFSTIGKVGEKVYLSYKFSELKELNKGKHGGTSYVPSKPKSTKHKDRRYGPKHDHLPKYCTINKVINCID